MSETTDLKFPCDPDRALADLEAQLGPFAHESEEKCGAAHPSEPGVVCNRTPHAVLGVRMGACCMRSFKPDGSGWSFRGWHDIRLLDGLVP